MRVLITGANGFVGRHIVDRLGGEHQLTLLSGGRTPVPERLAGKRWIERDLQTPGDLEPIVRDHDVVIHLAGLAHVTRRSASDTWERFEAANVGMTRRLAEAAAAAGVRRFVLMSSGAVNGIETFGRPFVETDPYNPASHYGRSKMLAEQVLRDIGARAGMEWVVLRPPVLVGPAAPGNVGAILKIIRTGLPLPFASIDNRRSYLGVQNFADLVALAVSHPAAADEVFLLTDAPSLSTPSLIRILGEAAGLKPRLLPCPPVLLKAAAVASGRSSALRPLWATLELDATKAVERLGWRRTQPLEIALRETAQAFDRDTAVTA